MRFLFDSNVIIDAISSRPQGNEASKELFLLAGSFDIDACLVSKQIADIHYCLRKYISDEAKRRAFASFLLEAFKILPLEKEDLQKALSLDAADYEDAVLITTASRYGIDAIVTNNQKDFPSSPVKILTPKEALAKSKSERIASR